MAMAFPERPNNWPETAKKVSVVYYLSRNGQLDHPHFMEIFLSSSNGLFLKDVINRLNFLRGNGMAALYSWSSKRSYKNGFVWNDLSKDDLIYPSHGHEYVLKGSELPRISPENELLMTDAATQTGELRRRLCRRTSGDGDGNGVVVNSKTAELRVDDTWPPPSSSSSEGLETAVKEDESCGGAFVYGVSEAADRAPGWAYRKLRAPATAVLMNIISCGSIPLRINGGVNSLPALDAESKEMNGSMIAGIRIEDREYFSGSLIETNKKAIFGNGAATAAAQPVLKRSSSYSADRRSLMEIDGDRSCRGILAVQMTARARARENTRR